MNTQNSTLEQLNILRGNIVHTIANVNGTTEAQTQMWLSIILGYIVILLLLMFIHRKILRKQKKIHENLVIRYDTVRYQIAKAQYGNPTIQESKGIQTVIQAEHKNYSANAAIIKQEILAMEQKNGQTIISEDQRKKINRETKKKNIFTLGVQIIGRVTTILTIGIYKLFW